MFTSTLRSVARCRGPLLRAFATPKKESGKIEITKPATHPDFTGYTNSVQFRQHAEPFLCYRIMNEDGQIIAPKEDPHLSQEKVVAMYSCMIKLNTMDNILYDAQRQGRLSFYMTNYGEEATHIGSASALEPSDVIFGQYREAGVLMWRGFSYSDFVNQCVSNSLDPGKGRQMPVHYGSVALNFHTISSPLGTQLPQAAGAAYSLKLSGAPNVVICYFGEGAASEGDFHSALNMAATTESPVIFFCRNNGYAISTPSKEQYRGDGIASRGLGYGINTIRVDGNDLFAVHNATKAARKMALAKAQPVLIEAMTYRGGHHSTSDDSTRYRDAHELKSWNETNNPIRRFRSYMEAKGWWSQEKEDEARSSYRAAILKALSDAEALKKPSVKHLFADVLDEKTEILKQQEKQMLQHMAKYSQHYNANLYEQ